MANVDSVDTTFNCPDCGQPLLVGSLLPGQVVSCGHCNHEILVPQSVAPARPPVPFAPLVVPPQVHGPQDPSPHSASAAGHRFKNDVIGMFVAGGLVALVVTHLLAFGAGIKFAWSGDEPKLLYQQGFDDGVQRTTEFVRQEMARQNASGGPATQFLEGISQELYDHEAARLQDNARFYQGIEAAIRRDAEIVGGNQ